MTDYEPTVRAAAISAYTTRLVSHADTLRARAQGAYSTLSTLAGGLLGVGLLANLPHLTSALRLSGLLSVLAWAAAVVAFLVAGATSVNLHPPDRGATIVEQIQKDVLEEQNRVQRRLRIALAMGAVAVAATTSTLALAVFHYPNNSARAVSVLLTPAGADLLAAHCSLPRSREAVVDVDGLTSSSTYLNIVVAEGPAAGCQVLVARTSILGFGVP